MHRGMASNADAPGFRFQPTDQELVNCYLRPKVLQELQLNFIPEVDLYKCEPWELPDKAFSSSSGADGSKVEWYLFAPRDRKYGPKSVRMNRATPLGFWKSTGKDRSVKHHHMDDAVIGKKKTLVYHHGRAPNGEHTDWVMREYRLHRDGMATLQDTYALCRLYKKNATTSSPDVSGVAITDTETEGAPMQSMPNVAAADTEGPSDEEQFNIDDFITDEDMNQVNIDNFLAGEDMNQFYFDNLFADEGMNQFNFDNLFTDEDMEQFNLDNLFAP